jgi:hypothetical protein
MRFNTKLLALCFGFAVVTGQVKDGCPKLNVACLDIINSSQCIEQLVLNNPANVTRAGLIECVDTPGVSSSDLPGATKVSSDKSIATAVNASRNWS